jgi:hypothetical protein
MHIPDEILGKLKRTGPSRNTLCRWQWSLRTLFILTTVCSLLAWFHAPLWAWAQSLWEIWFPRYNPSQCGPCGMG